MATLKRAIERKPFTYAIALSALERSSVRIPRGSEGQKEWLPRLPEHRPSRWDGFPSMTEEVWDRIEWNPYRIGIDQWATDSSADPKPTWNELVSYMRTWQLNDRVEKEHRNSAVSNRIKIARDVQLSGPTAHPLHTDGIHSGEGLTHMPALIHLSSRATLAGDTHSRMVMRAADQSLVEMWTNDHRDALLLAESERTNLVESARNVIASLLEPDRVLFMDETKPEADRQAALDRVLAALEPATLDASMAKVMASLADKTALPKDLSTAKTVLLERIEAATMAKIKDMRGVVSQQGIDRRAACDDAENAEKKVSQAAGIAAVVIEAAETIEAAQTAFDAGVAEIKRVVPLNVPEWQYPVGTPLQGDTLTVWAKTCSLKAVQPDGVPGIVAAGALLVPNDDGSRSPGSVRVSRASNDVDIELTGHEGGVATFQLTARNICGPASTLKVLLDDR